MSGRSQVFRAARISLSKVEILPGDFEPLREPHDVHAEPALKFAIYCVEPLGVKIDVAPVSPDSFKLLIAKSGLAQLFGQVEPRVRAAIADGVNEAVAGAEDALYIDILAKVQEAINAPAAPQTGGGAGKPPKPVKEPILQLDGEPIEATLGEDQMMRLALPAGTEDLSEIVVLARRSEDRDEGEGEIEIKAVDEDGGSCPPGACMFRRKMTTVEEVGNPLGRTKSGRPSRSSSSSNTPA